ncbi:M56 family metallopeptidase [Pedobacter gandavensis]|uniref:M56 family metallopeptidase n=1 Tax=Pedobacter gandavensis TaxID=2679963 RepID=UPI00292EA1B0|nr:M56 family metallopeptidase [Pedobacter gandavensis]
MESIIFKTLLHSLWQGLILAFITAAVLVFTNRSSARLRYNLLISCFILFSVGVFASFIYEWKFETPLADSGKMANPGVAGNGTGWSAITASQPDVWIGKLWSYLIPYTTNIVLIWLLVVAAKSIQLFAGLYSIKRLRNTKITAAGAYWQNRVWELALKFGINRMVTIVQSGLVNVPMVVGYFKPLILLPIGLLNNLSKEEVEAIICHELAHVKRRDYLVNILQSIMELVFFFNPAVLWISELIREERENCCDDLAVLNTNNKVGYISALVSCEEFQMNKPQYAMAIADKPGQLLKRVKRMVSSHTPTLNKMELRIMGIALVSMVVLTMIIASLRQDPDQSVSNSNEQVSVEKEKSVVDHLSSAVDWTASKAKNMVSSIGSTVFQTSAEKAEPEKMKAELERMKAEMARMMAETGKVISKTGETISIAGDTIFGTKLSSSGNEETSFEAQKMAIATGGRTTEVTEPTIDNGENGYEADQSRTFDEILASVPKSMKATTTKKSSISSKLVSEGGKAVDEKISEYILNDLIKDRLVKRDDRLSFEMNKDKFVLNKMKLPEGVRKRYTQKYIKSPDWIIAYEQESESK